MIKFTNPRLAATFSDWPLGGSKRGRCNFIGDKHPKRGVRIGRQTTGKIKFTTYHPKMAIVDGSNGRTYILATTAYGFITIIRSNFMSPPQDEIEGGHGVFPDKDSALYAELLALIDEADGNWVTG